MVDLSRKRSSVERACIANLQGWTRWFEIALCFGGSLEEVGFTILPKTTAIPLEIYEGWTYKQKTKGFGLYDIWVEKNREGADNTSERLSQVA